MLNQISTTKSPGTLIEHKIFVKFNFEIFSYMIDLDQSLLSIEPWEFSSQICYSEIPQNEIPDNCQSKYRKLGRCAASLERSYVAVLH